MGALVRGERTGRWRRVMRGVYAAGPEAPDAVDRARARVLARDGVASRVLAVRPPGAPATESLLETLMVQLARRVADLPPPVRQHVVFDRAGCFVARVDLCWPELGLFIELDGQQHRGRPVYDARRATAVAAATGWLCGRFTWRDVTRVPTVTLRRLADLVEHARRRPLPAAGRAAADVRQR